MSFKKYYGTLRKTDRDLTAIFGTSILRPNVCLGAAWSCFRSYLPLLSGHLLSHPPGPQSMPDVLASVGEGPYLFLATVFLSQVLPEFSLKTIYLSVHPLALILNCRLLSKKSKTIKCVFQKISLVVCRVGNW